jgi:hypothetical protein
MTRKRCSSCISQQYGAFVRQLATEDGLQIKRRSRQMAPQIIHKTFRFLGMGILGLGLALASALTTNAQSGYLFNNFNGAAITNGPQHATTFTLSQSAQISWFATYHWNNGQGAVPGTITITPVDSNGRPSGTPYGPYGMGTQSGQTGIPDTAWVGNINGLVLQAGRYEVQDSDPNTWSANAQSGFEGFFRLAGTTNVTTTPPAPAPQASPVSQAQPPSVSQPASAPLTVTLAPVTGSYVFVNGQSAYTISFSWSAAGGTGPLSVTIEDSNLPGYANHKMPGMVNLPYPARTTASYSFTQVIPSSTLTFHAVVTDSAGRTATSAEIPIP